MELPLTLPGLSVIGCAIIFLSVGLDVLDHSSGLSEVQTLHHVTFLWGNIKETVYTTKPKDLTELETAIRDAFATLTRCHLRNAVEAVPARLRKLITNTGAYVEF